MTSKSGYTKERNAVFDTHSVLVDLRYLLFDETNKDFKTILKTTDILDMIGALRDTVYVCHSVGLVYRMNLNPSDDMDKNDTYVYGTTKAQNDYYQSCVIEFNRNLLLFRKAVIGKDLNGIKAILLGLKIDCNIIGLMFSAKMHTALSYVYISNMTAACNGDQDAIDAIVVIKNKQLISTAPTFKLSPDGKYWIIYGEVDGKILKYKYCGPIVLPYTNM